MMATTEDILNVFCKNLLRRLIGLKGGFDIVKMFLSLVCSVLYVKKSCFVISLCCGKISNAITCFDGYSAFMIFKNIPEPADGSNMIS